MSEIYYQVTEEIKMLKRSDNEVVCLFKPGSASICYVTTPDENVAKKLAQGIISNKLAACVNIIPRITSIYEWEGKVNEDSEVMMMIKTTTARVDDLAKFVKENHPYSVAEVISTPIENGNPLYLKWIGEMVLEKKSS